MYESKLILLEYAIDELSNCIFSPEINVPQLDIRKFDCYLDLDDTLSDLRKLEIEK